MNFLIEDCVVYNISGTNLQWYKSWEVDNTVRNNHMYPDGVVPPDSVLLPALELAGPAAEYAYVHDPSYWGLTGTKQDFIPDPGYPLRGNGMLSGRELPGITLYDIRGRKIGQWPAGKLYRKNAGSLPGAGCYIFQAQTKSSRIRTRIIAVR
ncbi:MAG: hypothetical protein GF350_08425 [Chitinivibrionales bacterium]|nr:hypothetical protein [Chitinivibrionales bacterium]